MSSRPPPRRFVGVVALLIGVLLALSAAAYAFTRDDRVGAGPTAAGTTTTVPAAAGAGPGAAVPTTAPKPGPFDAFLPVAERFVEQHRGLQFKQPVKLTSLDDAAFRKRLLSDQSSDAGEIQKTAKVLRALGLIAPGTDVAKAEDQLQGGAVVGFYDPKSKDLVVRGVKLTPFVRETVVHELTHALQDQWFGVDRPALDKADDERADGFLALVEGDAVRIEHEYRSSLPAAEQRQAETESTAQGSTVGASIPPVLIELLTFPYDVGPSFVDAVVRAKGQAGLDAAFVTPPSTTEQLLHPQKFLAGEGARPMAAPPADGPVIDHGMLGESGLDVVLGRGVDDGTLTPEQVAAAGAGWGGDQYVAWDQGGRSCVRDRIVTDTPRDMTELEDALRLLASRHRSVTIASSGSQLTLTSCG